MVTKDQAMTETEFHYGECVRTVGPRGGVTERVEHWRPNGALKVWKTRPDEWRLPIKYGMRGYSYIDQYNADQFHVAGECPLNQEGN